MWQSFSKLGESLCGGERDRDITHVWEEYMHVLNQTYDFKKDPLIQLGDEKNISSTCKVGL